MGYKPAADYPRVYARVYEPGEPRYCSIAVPAPKALAEGGEHIVKLLIVAVYKLLLYAFGGDILRYVYNAVPVRLGGEYGQLYGVKSRPHVAVGYAGDVVVRPFVYLRIIVAHAPFLIGHGDLDALLYVLLGQRVKLKGAAAGNDSPRHGDHGVFRGGAYEFYYPALQSRQYAVALGLAPAVAFIEQEVRLPAVKPEVILRRRYHLAHVLYAGGHRVKLYELRACGVGHY